MSSKVFRVLLGAVIFIFVQMVSSQNFLRADDSRMEDDPTTRASIKSRHIFESEIDNTSNEIEVNESQFDFSKEFKAGELPVTFGLTVKEIDINENAGAASLPSRLVGKEILLGTKFPAPFLDSDHYFVGVDVIPSMHTDDWDFKSSAFRIPFRTYLIYKQSDEFILVLGATIRPQFDTVATPIIGVIYKPNDRLTFNLASSEPNITYKLNEQLMALAEFGFSMDEYEVTRNGQDGVVFKYNESSFGGGFKYDLTKNIEAMLTAGGVFGRYIEYRDKVDKTIPETGLYTNFKLSAKF